MKIQDVLKLIDERKAAYPESIFPDDGTPMGNAAKMARVTCDNLKNDILKEFAEEGDGVVTAVRLPSGDMKIHLPALVIPPRAGRGHC